MPMGRLHEAARYGRLSERNVEQWLDKSVHIPAVSFVYRKKDTPICLMLPFHNDHIQEEITMEKMIKTSLNDDALTAVAGGYLQVSQWVQFLSYEIIGPLNNLAASASGSDRTAVLNYLATLQSTCVPGASVAGPVQAMWSSYNSSGRAAIQDSHVRDTLDDLLGRANNYIVMHC